MAGISLTREDHEPENLQFRETAGGLVPYRPTHIYNINDAGQPVFPYVQSVLVPRLIPFAPVQRLISFCIILQRINIL